MNVTGRGSFGAFGGWFIVLWVISAAVSLLLMAGVVWAVIHFVSKYW
jgi:hypothetical protein